MHSGVVARRFVRWFWKVYFKEGNPISYEQARRSFLKIFKGVLDCEE